MPGRACDCNKNLQCHTEWQICHLVNDKALILTAISEHLHLHIRNNHGSFWYVMGLKKRRNVSFPTFTQPSLYAAMYTSNNRRLKPSFNLKTNHYPDNKAQLIFVNSFTKDIHIFHESILSVTTQCCLRTIFSLSLWQYSNKSIREIESIGLWLNVKLSTQSSLRSTTLF